MDASVDRRDEERRMSSAGTAQQPTNEAAALLSYYHNDGCKLVRLSRKTKQNVDKDWQNRDVPPSEILAWYERGGNIGMQLGAVSDWRGAADCDCPEAVALAPRFLPETLRLGKGSGVPDVYLYRSPELGFAKFTGLDGETLIDLKASNNGAGHQIAVPPSIHPDKGAYRWVRGYNPASIAEVSAAALRASVGRLAVATLIARNMPPKGAIHDFELALAGFLLRPGRLEQGAALEIMLAAWRVAGVNHREAERGVENALSSTAENIAAGQRATGGRILEELVAGMPAKIAKFLGWERAAGRDGAIMRVGNSQGLPKIIVNNRHLRDMTADALGALEAANTPPAVFVRSGRLVRIQDDENGTPVITTLTDNHVKGRLARVADCVKVYKDKNEVREARVSPPDVVVRDIQALDRFPFPPLEAVVETPVVRPDGTIFDTPGYDPATRLYYHPALGFAPRAVPDQPTAEDRRRALVVLSEAIGEFPYADGSSAANTLALMLTPLLRQAVDLVPIALLDKPQAGTGGSLLAEVVAGVATGRPADMFGAPSRDDEWSKKLTAKFASGSTMLIIDNVDGALYAPSLARALTSRSWTDRVLGLSEMITVRQRATWIATGNNIQLQGDLPRRCYWIRLDAKASRPWEREGFRHPDLLRWVGENRDRLVHALLTLVRSWYAAGKPKDGALPRLGSFEAWAETVGGVLAHAGVEGFLGNLEALYSKADEGGAEWEAFLDAWWRTWGEDGKTVKAVAEEATKPGVLRDTLPGELAEALGKNEGSFTRKLGKALASRIGTRYGDEGLHVEETGTHRRSKVWSVFKGSDGPKGTKECEFVSFVSLFESNAGENNKTRLHNGEKKYPPPPQTNSTNSQTHTPPDAPPGVENDVRKLFEAPPAWLRTQVRLCREAGAPERLLEPLAAAVAAHLHGDPTRADEVAPFVRDNLAEAAG